MTQNGTPPSPYAAARSIRADAGIPALSISHLRKTYWPVVAVDDVSIEVEQGEIFGILGPNGAGKTTTVECAIGLRRPDSGTIRVMGLDPQADREQVHEIVGVQLQSSALPAKLRVGEILDMYQSFYRNPADIEELIKVLDLGSKRHDYYGSLSGGQRQRVSIALALIGQPKIAVLDEMTTGLDPQARRDTWDLIDGVRARGVTIVLVTHFMEEAQRLCDRLAVIDSGRVIALDTPAGLVAKVSGGKQVRFRPSAPFTESLLTDLPEVANVEHDGDWIVVTGKGELVNTVIITLHEAGVTAHDVQLDSSSLEDAFVKLIGRHLPAEGASS